MAFERVDYTYRFTCDDPIRTISIDEYFYRNIDEDDAAIESVKKWLKKLAPNFTSAYIYKKVVDDDGSSHDIPVAQVHSEIAFRIIK